MRRIITVAGVALFSIIFLIHPGQAHTSLIGSSPAAGSTLSEFPDVIMLEFSEPLLVLGDNRTNYLELFGPDGVKVELEESSAEGSRLSAQVERGDLMSGVYTVSYRVVAGDGHVLRGEFAFEFQSLDETDQEIRNDSTGSVPEAHDDPSGNGRATFLLLALILMTALTGVGIFLRSGSPAK